MHQWFFNSRAFTGIAQNGNVSDRVIPYLRVCGFPPLRQKKGARMGHGRWCINKRSENH
jgi:hypothetical protein